MAEWRQCLNSFQFSFSSLIESNLNWRLVAEQDQWYARCSTYWEAICTQTAFNRHWTAAPKRFHGGTAAVALH